MSDVIIIGGGPAGAALGCYLSKAGISNSIFEKANHPRPHVGESLVTNTTRIFDELGFIDTLEEEGFVRKYGATWHAPGDAGKVSIVFGECPLPGVQQPYSYHLDRSKFDLLLLKHAESLGSKVYQGVQVSKVLFEDGRACGVRVRIENQEVELACKVVVDASGRDTFLGRHLRLKEKDPIFNQYAIHAWYEDVDRGEEGTWDDIHIFFLELEKAWVWQIPIDDEVTSIGVVTEKKDFLKSGQDLETFFNSHIQSSPKLIKAMEKARRINEFTPEGDYSYSMRKLVGDGYALIGDAARFVDPIFSSGISIALHSAKFASECIREALEADDYREEILKPYEEKLNVGVSIWYEFILLYYKLPLLFTYFVQKPEYRLQVFRLLQGEVYDREEVPVLTAMREFIVAAEESEDHVFHSRLTDTPID